MRCKTKRPILSAAVLSAVILSLAAVAGAQTTTNAHVNLERVLTWDPYGRAPITPPAAQWIAPDWKGPEKMLPEVSFKDIPFSIVSKSLSEWFKEGLEVIAPPRWDSPPMGASGQVVSFKPDEVSVNLHLKDVNAEELFNAMNLAFEAENAPVRWRLQMNGDHPLAILRVLPALLPQLAGALNATPTLAAPTEKLRKVFFVGDLLGNGVVMEKLYRTVCDVYDKGYTNEGGATAQNDIKFHEEAQLLIVNATPDRVDFVQNTLAALREKARRTHFEMEAAAVGPEAPKKPDATPKPKP